MFRFAKADLPFLTSDPSVSKRHWPDGQSFWPRNPKHLTTCCVVALANVWTNSYQFHNLQKTINRSIMFTCLAIKFSDVHTFMVYNKVSNIRVRKTQCWAWPWLLNLTSQILWPCYQHCKMLFSCTEIQRLPTLSILHIFCKSIQGDFSGHHA